MQVRQTRGLLGDAKDWLKTSVVVVERIPIWEV
jgi:hypothetical protein